MSGVQNMTWVPSSALQSKVYVMTTGGARAIHTNYLDRDCIKRCMTKMGMMIAGAWAGEQLRTIFRHWSDHWGRFVRGTERMIGVVLLVTDGVTLLSSACVCTFFTPANWKNGDKGTRGCTAAELRDFEKHVS